MPEPDDGTPVIRCPDCDSPPETLVRGRARCGDCGREWQFRDV